MTYLMLIFVSPLYLATRKKWVAFVFNLIFYILAWVMLLTIILAWLAPLFWLLAVGQAMWDYRTEAMHEQAEIMASKMAKAMKDS